MCLRRGPVEPVKGAPPEDAASDAVASSAFVLAAGDRRSEYFSERCFVVRVEAQSREAFATG
jgi:hypothetical protein